MTGLVRGTKEFFTEGLPNLPAGIKALVTSPLDTLEKAGLHMQDEARQAFLEARRGNFRAMGELEGSKMGESLGGTLFGAGVGAATKGFVAGAKFAAMRNNLDVDFDLVAARMDSATARSISAETEALRRMAANNRAGSPWSDLRLAYQQAKREVDFAHIEADVRLWKSGRVEAKGGHFSASPQVQMIPGTRTVASNGVIEAKVNLLGPDSSWYLKTNNGGLSTLTPTDWSLARAKGEMSQAFLRRRQEGEIWHGDSSGVMFQFNPPNKNVSLWRGYPLYEK